MNRIPKHDLRYVPYLRDIAGAHMQNASRRPLLALEDAIVFGGAGAGKLAFLEAAAAGLEGDARGDAKRAAAQRWAALTDAERLQHQQRALKAGADALRPQSAGAPRLREGRALHMARLVEGLDGEHRGAANRAAAAAWQELSSAEKQNWQAIAEGEAVANGASRGGAWPGSGQTATAAQAEPATAIASPG